MSCLQNLRYFNSIEITGEERSHANKLFSFLSSAILEEQLKKQNDHISKDSCGLQNWGQRWKESIRNRAKALDSHSSSIISDAIDTALVSSLHNFDLSSKFEMVSLEFMKTTPANYYFAKGV
jgi:hypothetical protein